MLTVIPVDGGPFSSRSYIIQIGEECWIVDCSDYPALKSLITLPIKGILLTHGHFDHIQGLNVLLDDYPLVRIYTNEIGREMLMNPKKNLSHYHDADFSLITMSCISIVKDRRDIMLGEDLKAIPVFTPGHNPSSITWIIGPNLFTGDSFIPGCKTVTNLPGGNRKQAHESLELIKELAIGRTIYPGHKVIS